MYMNKEQLAEFLKESLQIRVEVLAGAIPYEDGDMVEVRVKLVLDDEVISEDSDSHSLPTR